MSPGRLDLDQTGRLPVEEARQVRISSVQLVGQQGQSTAGNGLDVGSIGPHAGQRRQTMRLLIGSIHQPVDN